MHGASLPIVKCQESGTINVQRQTLEKRRDHFRMTQWTTVVDQLPHRLHCTRRCDGAMVVGIFSFETAERAYGRRHAENGPMTALCALLPLCRSMQLFWPVDTLATPSKARAARSPSHRSSPCP